MKIETTSVLSFRPVESQLKILPKSNREFVFTDFDKFFGKNNKYLYDEECKLSNFEDIKRVRMAHVNSFCKNWKYEKPFQESKAITLFTRHKSFECRVPKTGQL